MSGYYNITEGPTKVCCGMFYTRTSCLDIYNNNPETGEIGYYRINNNRFFPTCAGVRGGWKRVINFNITAGDDCPSGWYKYTQSGYVTRVKGNSYSVCSFANFKGVQ